MDKKRIATKTALAFSILTMIAWLILGTGTSLAWFTDTSESRRNSFVVGELELGVSYKNGNSDYVEVRPDTELFDDEALYEPGYTQVLYLRVENKGDIDFDYMLTIDVDDSSTVLGENEQGQTIYLPNFLKFGVVYSDTEYELEREVAREMATLDAGISLEGYTDLRSLAYIPSQVNAEYVALILYLPEEVGNVANYREDKIPSIKLGLTVVASQKGTMQ